MEQHYVFLKDNRVANIAVFATQDEALADAVAQEHGFDDAVWVGENVPVMFSTYENKKFTPPTIDYLFSIGVLDYNQKDYDLRVAESKKNLVSD